MFRNRAEERIEALRRLLRGTEAEGLYITGEANVSYFTGRSGQDCSLWISQQDACIITDFRYRETAQELTWLTYCETGAGKSEADIL